MRRHSLLLLVWVAVLASASAWVLPFRGVVSKSGPTGRKNAPSSASPSRLWAGGFGGGAGTAKESNQNKKKLKPKAQWDRFLDLKRATKVRVAVSKDGADWLECGYVKSSENAYTSLAVARQRALIAEHANRLFPLKISTKDPVAWAFWDDATESWQVVDKAVLESDDLPKGLEKLVGFEGTPDPSTGYYCLYNEGRLVNDADGERPASKKLK